MSHQLQAISLTSLFDDRGFGYMLDPEFFYEGESHCLFILEGRIQLIDENEKIFMGEFHVTSPLMKNEKFWSYWLRIPELYDQLLEIKNKNRDPITMDSRLNHQVRQNFLANSTSLEILPLD